MEWFLIILKINSKAVVSKAFEVRHKGECLSTNFAFDLSYDEQNTLTVCPRSHTHAVDLGFLDTFSLPHYTTFSLVLPLGGSPTSRPSHILFVPLSGVFPFSQNSKPLQTSAYTRIHTYTIFSPIGTHHNYN